VVAAILLLALMDDLVRTLDSDAEDIPVDHSAPKKRGQAAENLRDEGVALNPDFTFDLTGDIYQDALNENSALQDEVKTGSKPVRRAYVYFQRSCHTYEISETHLGGRYHCATKNHLYRRITEEKA
jgi:hypothetical protein